MLYAMIIDSRIERVVDSATDLDRAPAEVVRAMCRELKVPVRGLDERRVIIHAIRPGEIARCETPC